LTTLNGLVLKILVLKISSVGATSGHTGNDPGKETRTSAKYGWMHTM